MNSGKEAVTKELFGCIKKYNERIEDADNAMLSFQQFMALIFDATHHGAPKGSFTYTDWIKEEFEEFMAEKDGTPEQMKELCDLIWVCIQKANEQEYDLGLGFYELFKEYQSKFYTAEGEFQPIYREDGKLLKNSGFKKANFEQFF